VRNSLQFLIKFILTSAVIFLLWTPVSRAYFTLLSLEANAIFGLIDHDARFLIDSHGAQILYPDVFPPYQYKHDIRIPIQQSIAIHFNLIVAIGLFVAVPRMSLWVRLKGVAMSFALLSFVHTANIYAISFLFIWDYIAWQRWPPGIPEGHIRRLIVAVERRFPTAAQAYIVGFHNYSTHFLDETAPLLIWLYFAYPYLIGEVRVRPSGPEPRQRRLVRERAASARS